MEYFFKLVSLMRKSQIAYFKTPSIDYTSKQKFLNESKRYEREVDNEIKRINQLRKEAQDKKISPVFPELRDFFE